MKKERVISDAGLSERFEMRFEFYHADRKIQLKIRAKKSFQPFVAFRNLMIMFFHTQPVNLTGKTHSPLFIRKEPP